MKEKVIIKNVNGFYDGERHFVVIPVSEEVREKLQKFCEVSDSDELLFSISKFADIASVDGVQADLCAPEVGTTTVSVKLEATEYDWTYKGKKGKTKKWQVCGLLFKAPVVRINLEGLDDD